MKGPFVTLYHREHHLSREKGGKAHDVTVYCGDLTVNLSDRFGLRGEVPP